MVAAEYDRFAVVALAMPDVVEAVEEIRRRVPPSGRPILPAHVTVKGTFVEPHDLDAIAERIRACCADARPFSLMTIGLPTWTIHTGPRSWRSRSRRRSPHCTGGW